MNGPPVFAYRMQLVGRRRPVQMVLTVTVVCFRLSSCAKELHNTIPHRFSGAPVTKSPEEWLGDLKGDSSAGSPSPAPRRLASSPTPVRRSVAARPSVADSAGDSDDAVDSSSDDDGTRHGCFVGF